MAFYPSSSDILVLPTVLRRKVLWCLWLVFIAMATRVQGNSHTTSLSPRTCHPNQTSYDFIIIGGGTAGLTLASLLSKKLVQNCILIIEAGPDGRNEPGIYIPGRKGSTWGGKYDWNLTSIPQPHAANRSIFLPRGHVLGGSSALNTMCWDRGAKADYDAWEGLGNPGWNWEGMIEAMLSVENFTSSAEYGRKGGGGVGKGGVIQTLINRVRPAAQEGFIPAMQKLGLERNFESLGGDPVGVEIQPNNLRGSDYSRSYATSWLEQAGPNLAVVMETKVAKVNFDGNLKTTGITLEDGTIISAAKEVVVSAGSYLSPGILERSGIGNREILTKLGIETLHHLPGVGENLQDHPRIQNSYILKPGLVSSDQFRFNSTFVSEQLALWYANLTSEMDIVSSGFAYMPYSTLSTNLSTTIKSLADKLINETSPITLRKQKQLLSNPSIPQIEILFADGYTGQKGYPPPSSPQHGIQLITILGAVMHPFSRGSVHISSASITNHPILDPNYLSSPIDILALKTLARYLRTVATTAPLEDYWMDEYEPGLTVQTDDEWEVFTRGAQNSIAHPVGTCSMLKEEDGGVVSAELKVYGVQGLRVVDVSVVPLIVSGHIQTSAYGIAVRAAEIVAREWS